MNRVQAGLLRFQEGYFDRIWGGDKLRTVLGKDTPPGKVIGEAWLIADHATHESVVAEGPCAGQTLRQLLDEDAPLLLGSRAKLTIHGRFPLLLKLLDSAQALSVQVHPDDAAAQRLGEADVGKTEMWHVFDAEPGSELICGLDAGIGPGPLAAAIADGTVEQQLTRFEAPAGTSAFVAAGTVHAIGGGLLLAEIQQNSDLTYRLYDWGRVDTSGQPRELHIDKSIQVTHFGTAYGGPVHALEIRRAGAACAVLGACRYFAAELLHLAGAFVRTIRGESFHILLLKNGVLEIRGGGTACTLRPGEALLVPGALDAYEAEGEGDLLDYYVPDLLHDIVAPLRDAGHPTAAIARLGGAPETSDLTPLLA